MGWDKEKEEMKRRAFEKAKIEAEKDLVQQYKPSAKDLAEMHKATISLLKASLNYTMSVCVEDGKVVRMPDVQDIKRIWEIVKSEKLEPKETIGHSLNYN